MTETVAGYLAWLSGMLEPFYATGVVVPGHDVSHVLRMVARAPEVTTLPDLDQGELVAAIWLHNLDRAPALGVSLAEVETASLRYLTGSPFADDARRRVAVAAGEHSKKHDEPGDSPVLIALRVLDKVDRMNALGVITAAACHGASKPLYVAREPFCYALSDGGQPYSVYDDIAGRIMEWPAMIPPGLRYLIDVQGMRDVVSYVRNLAGHVCRIHGLTNGVESDLVKALGPDLYALYG